MYQEHIQHLYSRASFGIRYDRIEALLVKSRKEIVKELLHSSRGTDPITTKHDPVGWKAYRGMTAGAQNKFRREERMRIMRLNVLWLGRMASGETELREKMALFWHGHFANRTMKAFFNQRMLKTVRENALGNFGDLLLAVSKEPAMLEFLNNQQNKKDAPNENFARELMELFTLGRGNYSEKDIKEAARAFTGWGFNKGGEYTFRQWAHDDEPKDFRGKTGNYRGEDIIELILQDRQCARFISGKLYRYFVNDNMDEDFVQRMADRFFASNYDIADLMEFVFTSDHFYQKENTGNRIKSPIELMAGLQKQFGISYDRNLSLMDIQRALGQVLFYPPNVAGWKMGRAWMDPQTLMIRLKLPSAVLNAGVLHWEEKGDMPEDVDVMERSMADRPMHDRIGRKIRTKVEQSYFLGQFDVPVNEAQLVQQLLRTVPSVASQNALRSMDQTDVWDLVVTIVSLPEYQLC